MYVEDKHDEILTRQAKRTNKRLQGWFSVGGTRSCRQYWCNLCNCSITTESGRHKPTQHAEASIEEHKNRHLPGSDLHVVEEMPLFDSMVQPPVPTSLK